MSTAEARNILDFALGVKPSASVVMVDPEMASRWLDRNDNNRNARAAIVAAYARDMKAGQWKITGDAIRFSKDGRLLDGQHRLHAVIRSGKTIAMFVVRGLDDDAQLVMDTGAKRTAADAFNLQGAKASVGLAAGARLAIRLGRGTADECTREAVTNSEIIGWVSEHPEFEASAEFAERYARAIPIPRGVLAYAAWRLLQVDGEACGEFFNQVALPDGIAAADPRAALNRRLTQMKVQRTVETPLAYLDLIFQAWNRYRASRSATLYRVNRNSGGRVILTEPK